MAVGGAIVVAASVLAGIGGWVGAASQHTGVGFGELLQAGVNIATPALFVLGVGTLCYAWWPRVGPRVTYAAVTWSLLAELAASVVKNNRLLVDSSILSHIRPVPAAPADWTAAAGLAGLGVVGGAAAIVSFGRRDLADA
jgi:ABC-2 type transport system permease protein